MNDIAKHIQQKQIGLFPCDTIWGIIGIMSDETAKKICQIKARSLDSGFVVLIPNLSYLAQLCSKIPDYARPLLETYWPGPVTFILPKHPDISNNITGQRQSIAIRLPNTEPLVTLLDLIQTPLLSSSANISNEAPIQDPKQLPKSLLEGLNFIYDKGYPKDTLPSTIVDCSGNTAKLIRQGSVIIDL